MLLSPRFKSVAEKAGWDEEALLLASLVVEDTPERNAKKKKRSSDSQFKSPPSSSRRKRRARRRSPVPMSIAVLDLEQDESTNNNNEQQGDEKKSDCCTNNNSLKKVETNEEKTGKETSSASSSSITLPCVDRLREELSCAICLDICFEPSTTPCGHSFCKKCLKNAADKCGKRCPKCRQLISNGRSCTINTVLWNTIQLLFPIEVEARKAAEPLNSRENERQNPGKTDQHDPNLRTTRRLLRPVGSRRDGVSISRREETGRGVANQDEDAALALRMQREEFMTIYRGTSLARDNLRAMARAINLRVRHRAV